MGKILSIVCLLMLLAPWPASAQQYVRLQQDEAHGTIDATTDSIVLNSTGVGGFGTVKIQTLDTYTGTWEVQCSVDGTTYDQDNPLQLKKVDSSTIVTEVSDEVSVWDVVNAAACYRIKVQPTAGFSGTDTVIWARATQTGGAGSGGGGGGVASTVAISQSGTDNDVDATLSLTLTETEDNSVAAGQSVDAVLNLPYMYNGSAWVRTLGNATDGLLVNLGTNNDVTVTSGSITATQGTAANLNATVVGTGTFATQVSSLAIAGVTGTIFDLTNSNPLATQIVDASGDAITSFGGGTQYTEDLAAAGDPVGTAVNLVRADTPGTITNTNGDNVAQRGTNYGAAYVQVVSSSGAFIDSFGGAGGTAIADEGTFTLASTSITPMGCIEATDSMAAGTVGGVKCGADRELDVDVTNAFALDATVTTIFGSDAVFGTAGTADADVLTVQGITSMTPLQVQSNSINLATTVTTGGAVPSTATYIAVTNDAGNLTSPVVLSTGADNITNNADALQVAAFNYVHDGTNWDRWAGAVDTEATAAATLQDNTPNPTTGAMASYMMCFDGSTWDRCTVAVDWTIGTAIGTTGPGGMAVYSDFDGSALPTATNVDTEGEGVPIAASIKGVQYSMLTNEDGSKSPISAEDTATADLDSGLVILARRTATPANTSGTDGDLEYLQMSAGRLWASTLLTDGTDTALVTTTAGGALQVECVGGTCSSTGSTPYDHGEAITLGSANGLLSGGRVSAAAPSTTGVVDDDFASFWVLNTGAQVVDIVTAGTLAFGSGTTSVATIRVVTAQDDPVNDAAVKFDAQMVADSAASAGNPIYVGGIASSSLVADTPAADANRIGFAGGLDRVQITRPHANLEDRLVGDVAITDGSSTALGGGFAAGGSGVRVCATTLIIGNSSATNVDVDIRDGAAGSVLLNNVPAAANQGGAVIVLPVPICSSANTALAADPSASASTITINAIGFKTEL